LHRSPLHRLHRARDVELRPGNHRTLRNDSKLGVLGRERHLPGEWSVQFRRGLHRSQARQLPSRRLHHGMPRDDEVHVSSTVRVRDAGAVHEGPRRSEPGWLHRLLHARAGVRVADDGWLPQRSSPQWVRLWGRRHDVSVRNLCLVHLHQRCLAVHESALLIRPSGTWRASPGTRWAARSARCHRGDSRFPARETQR